VDRCPLVGGFLKAEALAKRCVIGGSKGKGVPFAQAAARIEIEQLGSGIARLLRSFALGFLPLSRAELVERSVLGSGSAVARDKVQLGHRHIKACVVEVGKMEKLVIAFAKVHVHQAPVTPNAVIHMHDWIAGLELRQITDQGVDIALRFAPS